jgi:hypothetical protein
MLGATFVSEDTGRLHVTIPLSSSDGEVVHESLAGRIDTVHSGLPAEYLDGILDVVDSETTAQLLGAGSLRFCCAAHGELGSSPWLFRGLSRIVIQLLSMEHTPSTDEQLIEFIQEQLRYK